MTLCKYTCNYPGCNAPAIAEAVYQLRHFDGQKPDVTTPIARLCMQHSQVNLWDKLHNRNQWKLIEEAFKGMNRSIPRERFSNIYIQPIGTAVNVVSIKTPTFIK